MKPRYIELASKKVIISMIISGILCLGMIILISNDVTAFIDNKIVLAICAILIMIVTFGSFVIFITTSEMLLLGMCYNHKMKKQYLKSCKEIQKLSGEFSEVYLRNFEEQEISKIISKDEVKCKARLDENNEIIYNIYVNFETSTDDYETFLKYFEI